MTEIDQHELVCSAKFCRGPPRETSSRDAGVAKTSTESTRSFTNAFIDGRCHFFGVCAGLTEVTTFFLVGTFPLDPAESARRHARALESGSLA